ncbi:AzlC family ABC transporter permease [Snodgrassella sp. CFCC 13594]|uniref:AzlC family ABC transporter permease n=1 Tax=Snodgrassella sp. CFCC 13594 TaxID=1775559 RepID=UPI00082E5652|nr:AzlC family ABC transporter permease [Snodgrassella sp. CFCC 13594]
MLTNVPTNPSAPTRLSARQRLQLAFKYSAPVAMGYYPAGLAYGVLMSASGLPWWLSLAMSMIVYSGAAQYASIPLLASGAGALTLTLNAFVINLRHVFYGLPLLPALPLNKAERIYALFALTDESFSVLTTLPEPLRQPLFAPIVGLNQFYWVSATLIGCAVGSGLTDLVPHLDFALTCLFLILAYEQYRSKKAWWPCVLALVSFVLAQLLTTQYLLLSAVGLCVMGVVLAGLWPSRRAHHDA